MNKKAVSKSIVALAVLMFSLVGSTLPALAQSSITLNVEKFEVEGFNPLSPARTEKLLSKFTGKTSDLAVIYDAATALEEAIHAEGYSLISVSLPEQAITNSTIILQTRGFRVANIDAENNNHFSDENVIRSAASLQAGKNPNLKQLQRALSVANLHPSKRVKLNFISRDKDSDEVDVSLSVTDKTPQQFFAWINDTGNDDTGEYRLGLGYQHSNLFNRDHIATLTYTTSPDQTEDVRQIGVNYRIPIYNTGGFLDFLAFDSDVDSGLVADVFNVSGKGRTYRAGYTQLLAKRGS